MSDRKLAVFSINDALRDMPMSVIQLSKHPIYGHWHDGHGMICFWMIFELDEQRQKFIKKYYMSWMQDDERANYLDYCFQWEDAQGYGLQLAVYRPHLNGRRRI